MIKHLFKLVWHRKRQNLIISIEIFISFIILLGVFNMVIGSIVNFIKPLGFSYDNVWQVLVQIPENDTLDPVALFKKIRLELGSYKEIETVSFSRINVPYCDGSYQTSIRYPGARYSERSIMIEEYAVDDQFQEALNIPLVQGRWFEESDVAGRLKPVIINQALKEVYFGGKNAVGEVMDVDDRWSYLVVGLVQYFRHKGDFHDSKPALFQRLNLVEKRPEAIIVKTKAGTTVEFEQKLAKNLKDLARTWTFKVGSLVNLRSERISDRLTGMIVISVICGFLILNVILGLFGVLWNTVNHRKSEIGVRCALGAFSGRIVWQILGETLVLATLAILIGLLFAVQLPLLGISTLRPGVYFSAMISSILFIYLIVALCASYPGVIAARIKPADALHEE